MTAIPRELAEQSLSNTERELGVIPTGRVACDVMAAHAAQAQVHATIAVAQALLEIGDILRKVSTRAPQDFGLVIGPAHGPE
ncbi:hypothetical protein ACN6LM_003896 [Streptomyces sp. SAS_281]|uniref:hypothetical protein n=1 Tax=Streptomyces sp. SAS_281 TaxID=3412744 RepID=UPI00403D43CC